MFVGDGYRFNERAVISTDVNWNGGYIAFTLAFQGRFPVSGKSLRCPASLFGLRPT